MKQRVRLLPIESKKIRGALISESESLKEGFRKDWIYIIFNKIDIEKGQALLDGGEMELIAQCLRKQANFFEKKRLSRLALPYFQLANRIEEEKKQYQAENGPKIKTAASADTLTAAI